MKRFLLILTIIVLAFSVKATDYYVATIANGGSDANTGLIGSPWATLSYAFTHVPTGANTINIGEGTFNDGGVSNSIALNFNVIGAGSSLTIINCTYKITGTPTSDLTGASFSLVSATAGTIGNQTISGLTLDGGDGSSTAASRAITIKNRSYVDIHDCIIKDFYLGGIAYYSTGAWYDARPATYEVGNDIYNCTIDNCGDVDATWYGGGLILIACQQNMTIHDNLLYSNKRSGDHNGNIINGGGRHFKGVKYFNNQSWKPDATYSGWNFHLEIWGNDGGFEVYNNTFTGGAIAIDMGGHGPYLLSGYDIDWTIHDNVFKRNNSTTLWTDGEWILSENTGYTGKTLIYNNSFSGGYRGVRLLSWHGTNMNIYDNSFSELIYPVTLNYSDQGSHPAGLSNSFDTINIYRNKIFNKYNSGYFYGAFLFTLGGTQAISNLNILNNTVVTDNIMHQPAIELQTGSTSSFTNVNIKNNILCYFTNGGPYKLTNSGTMNGIHLENNFAYNLANYNVAPLITGNAITNYTFTNNIPTSNTTQVSPLFVNESIQDFHLQATSTAVNSGQVVSVNGSNLPYLSTLPDRGYIEYDGGSVVTLGTVSLGTSPVITESTVTVSASVTSAGGGTISERGIVYYYAPTPTVSNWKIVSSSGTGSYSVVLSNLNSLYDYYVRAYCINEAGIAYSNEITVRTLQITPTVVGTTIINGLTSSSSRTLSISASASSDGGGTISDRGICYSTSANPTLSNNVIHNGAGLGTFITTVTTLLPSTVYYFRSFVTNESGTAYSANISFITESAKPVKVSGSLIKINNQLINL